MVRFAVQRTPGSTPRRRLPTTVAALAVVLLLILSSCAGSNDALSSVARDDRGMKDKVVGWSLFHAAANQWQVESALLKLNPPWSQPVSLVEHLRPGAKAPRYQGELPVNTIYAPADPTTVGAGGQYGWRRAPDLGIEELHNGADIGAAQDSEVVAAMEGVVRAKFWDVWGGNRVEVAHTGNMVTTYNHLEAVLVEEGDRLEASQQLGTVGQTGSRVTGPHLHFETWVDGEAVDPQSFDWITAEGIKPAPRDRARNPPRIPGGGRGDKFTVDPLKSCSNEAADPQLCPSQGASPTRPNGQPTPGLRCPPTSGEGARTDCPPASPHPNLEACISTAPGIFNCDPRDPQPGPEDCPPAPVEGARTDCPAAPPDLTDPLQCQTVDQITHGCAPLDPPPPGPEDCPPMPAEGSHPDCPPAVPGPSTPSGNPSLPPAGDELAPFPGTEATLLGRRRTLVQPGEPGDPRRRPW